MQPLNLTQKIVTKVVQTLFADWWVEITTATPRCTYYFGLFHHLAEARDTHLGYVNVYGNLDANCFSSPADILTICLRYFPTLTGLMGWWQKMGHCCTFQRREKNKPALHNGGMNQGEIAMQCPECGSSHIRKNGQKKGKQNHICVNCGRQFIDHYDPPKGYPDEFKRECLKLYVNGSGLWLRHATRTGNRTSQGAHHTTVILWVKQGGQLLPDPYESETTPQVGELVGAACRRH